MWDNFATTSMTKGPAPKANPKGTNPPPQAPKGAAAQVPTPVAANQSAIQPAPAVLPRVSSSSPPREEPHQQEQAATSESFLDNDTSFTDTQLAAILTPEYAKQAQPQAPPQPEPMSPNSLVYQLLPNMTAANTAKSSYSNLKRETSQVEGSWWLEPDPELRVILFKGELFPEGGGDPIKGLGLQLFVAIRKSSGAHWMAMVDYTDPLNPAGYCLTAKSMWNVDKTNRHIQQWEMCRVDNRLEWQARINNMSEAYDAAVSEGPVKHTTGLTEAQKKVADRLKGKGEVDLTAMLDDDDDQSAEEQPEGEEEEEPMELEKEVRTK